MTIRERYAMYTKEELAKMMKDLEERMRYFEAEMDDCKERKNIEMYRMARANYDETYDIYMDVNAAYIGRA